MPKDARENVLNDVLYFVLKVVPNDVLNAVSHGSQHVFSTTPSTPFSPVSSLHLWTRNPF